MAEPILFHEIKRRREHYTIRNASFTCK